MSIEVLEGWQVKPLSKLCAEVIERVDPAAMNGDLGRHYLGLEHIGQGTGQLEGVGDASDVVSQKSRFHAGDILFGKLRPNLRKVARPDFGGVCSTDIIVLRARPNADPAFLFQVLQSEPVVAHAVATAAGTKMPRTHARSILSFEIAMPSLDEQRRIAEVLGSVDEAIVATEIVHAAAIRAQAATFAVFLASGNKVDGTAIEGWTTGKISGIEHLPVGWQIVRLVDVARLESGHTPDRKKSEYWDGGDIEWISLHDTQNLERTDIYRTEMQITQAGLDNSSARLLPIGTVCFSRTATVGKCVVMAKKMATSQDFANFVCSSKLNNRYLLHLMRWMQPVWKQLASGSTHKTIYMPTFKALQIILPPRDKQDQIVEVMDGYIDFIEEQTAALASLRSLKQSLMFDLLSGRVRVPG
nr:restriction endonuclease subunit S [Aminobacter aminovorans]